MNRSSFLEEGQTSALARRRRTTAARLIAGLLVAALAAAIGALLLGGQRSHHHRQARSTASAAALAHTQSAARPGPRSGSLARPAASARLRRLQTRLATTLRSNGEQSGAAVADLSDRTLLYAVRQDVPRPPASLEKLYTSVAALDLLGARARLKTTVMGVGRLGGRGVWHGNLYLRGGGDPTFGDGTWNRLYMGGQGPTATELVAQLRHDGIRQVTGWVYGDESLFDSDRGGPATHNRPDIPDYGGQLSALVYDHGMSATRMSPAVFATHELVLTMGVQGLHARAARRLEVTPAGATRLAVVSSPPLAELLRLMNVPSDDLIADLLAKQLGARLAGSGSLAAGAAEIRRVLARSYGLRPVIRDGSGLDRADRSTPAQVLELLTAVWGTPSGRVLYRSLPVLGRQGTVQGIGVGSYADGHCAAKTGTLNDVTNLAGYCTTRSRQTIAFALMIDGQPNIQAVRSLSHAVATIAAY
ncbi:MAG: D-alanyl-D-alanine carboxypeptidase/D-alanyl-D-alanine-endopeptidase [Solirubrobacteraceae bacterium]